MSSNPPSYPRKLRQRVLFVHPFANPHEATVPFGAVGLMNLTAAPKLGLYAHELSTSMLRDAVAVAMDLHWVHSLAAVQAISQEIRQRAPELPVVLGGYTATVFAKLLVAHGVADFVVRGDCEHSFPRLIAALRSGASVTEIPNLVGPAGATAWTYHLTPSDFDQVDYLSIDWFPSLLRQVHLEQARSKSVADYPLIVTHKGCRSQRPDDDMCAHCYGQPAAQQRLRRNRFVSRSAERVRQDLERLSADPVLRRAMLVYDVDGLDESWAEQVFSGSYDLHLHFEPTRCCSLGLLERVAGSVRSMDITLYYIDMARRLVAGEPELEAFVAAALRLGTQLNIFVDAKTAPALQDLARSPSVHLHPVEQELVPAPDPTGADEDLPEQYALHGAQSNQFAVLRLWSRVLSSHLDAIALDLGLMEAPEALAQGYGYFASGVWQHGHELAGNPIRRQLVAGGNPEQLAIEVAPFELPAQTPFRAFMQVPKAWLLAAPSRLGQLRFHLGQSEPVSLTAEWSFARPGRPQAVAVSAVSDRPERMRGRRYDPMWKLCLPLYQSDPVQPGDRRSVSAHLQYRLDGPLALRFALAPPPEGECP